MPDVERLRVARLTGRVAALLATMLALLVGAGAGAAAESEELVFGPWSLDWVLSLDDLKPAPQAAPIGTRLYLERQAAPTKGGLLVAIDRVSGAEAWRLDLGDTRRVGNLLARAGRLYVAAGTHQLYELEESSGVLVRRLNLPANRDAVRLDTCGADLCAVGGTLAEEDPAVPRALKDAEAWRIELGSFTIARRAALPRLKLIPDAILWRGDIVTLLTPEGRLECLDAAKPEAEPEASVSSKRGERLLTEERLFTIDAGTLWAPPTDNPGDKRRVALPQGTERLLAFNNNALATLRRNGAELELWSMDATGQTRRLGDWTGLAQGTSLGDGRWLALSDANGFALFDLARGESVIERPYPFLDAVTPVPLALSGTDYVVAIDLAGRTQLARFVPQSKLSGASGAPRFAPLKDLNARRLGPISGEAQWEAMLEAVRDEITALGLFSATSRGLAVYGDRAQITTRLLDLLYSRERGLYPLAVGELRGGVPAEAASLLRRLYDAIQIRLKLPVAGNDEGAKHVAETWPPGTSEEDFRRLARWLLEELGRQGYEHVAEIYRERLNARGMDYADQLDAFRVLLSRYDQEATRLNRWFEERFRWERVQPALNRKLAHLDAADALISQQGAGREAALFFMDFPLPNALWMHMADNGQEGRIAFTGVQLSQGYASWLSEALKTYQALDAKERRNYQAPITLLIKKDRAVVGLFKPQAQRTFEVEFAAIAKDGDEDGWADLEENILGLNPARADSDGDGIPDGMDANPLVGAADAKNNEQLIAQAVAFHECRVGRRMRAGAQFLGERAYLRTRFVDFAGITPVELPTCGQVYLEPPKAFKPEVCSFVAPKNVGPLDATLSGNILFDKTQTEAWVSWNCRDKAHASLRVYHLRKLLKRWIVLDASDQAPDPEGD